MAYLNINFNNKLISKHELTSIITKIGRNPNNEIVIDNAGVSGNHAEIIQERKKYIIHDINSTNGVFVNGERITEKELQFGDEIGIFKHKLRFAAIDSPINVTDSPPIENSTIAQGATVDIDVSKLGDLLKEQEAQKAYLEVSSGKMSGRKFKLTKPRFSIGKSPDCDVQIGGWFAPKIATEIVRQSDGYYLVPRKSGRPLHNGVRIKTRVKIRNGSNIEIRGTKFRFLNLS